MNEPTSTELGPEHPVEDVLDQLRVAGEPSAEPPADEPPAEVDEADYVDQRIEVPLEDDRYPGAPG